MTTFVRLLDVPVDDKGKTLRDEVLALASIPGIGAGSDRPRSRVAEADPTTFREVPGTPFAYWLTPSILERFTTLEKFDNGSRTTRVGLGTLDDYQFLRLWTECSPLALGAVWVPLANGGSFSRYFGDIIQVVLWRDSGRCLKAFVEAKVGSATRKIQSEAFYFRSGVTWPLRAKAFCPKVMPAGCAFSARGYAAFAPSSELLPITALGSSIVFDALYKLMLGRFGFPEFLVGVLGKVPMPSWTSSDKEGLGRLAYRGWQLMRELDTIRETSHAFLLPPTLRACVGSFSPVRIDEELVGIQREINDHAFRLYGIHGEDRTEIEQWLTKQEISVDTDVGGTAEAEAEGADVESEADEAANGDRDTLLSWLVGVAFGRFDPRLATGKRPIPPEPEPFDPLPARSPGMWPEGEPRDVEPPVLLVDDPGHAEDISTHLLRVAGEVDCHVPEDLRAWLARDFFPLHIRMYSKSRRKAPIYWQLATASASYSIWLYIHAFTKDTFYKVQNDYAAPKLEHEIRRLENLRRELGETPRPADRKILAAQETFVEELSAFLEEVKRITPLWNPDLDDGVLINFAPLHRLVPHHKPWQKELRATWDALSGGEYDWAHLAMHLWPERVVPKCATDRSLAIAHGLEDAFWLEDTAGKWRPRATPQTPVEDLVRERTSPAVKAALASLRDAPTAQGTSKPARRKGAR